MIHELLPAFARESIATGTAWRWSDSVTHPLMDLRGTVAIEVAMVTTRRLPLDRDHMLYAYGAAPALVRYAVEDFIPHSPVFRYALERPQEFLDWDLLPRVREVRELQEHLFSAGYTQGVSFALMSSDRVIGSLHLNIKHSPTFSDAEMRAIDAARDEIQDRVASMVLARDVGLSGRELEVLALLALGGTNPGIAEVLVISRRTVDRHVEAVLRKLGASNRVQAVRTALELGLA